MLDVHELETLQPDDGDEGELFVQLAVKMAGCLPNDPDQAQMVMNMMRTMYATLTDLRQRASAP